MSKPITNTFSLLLLDNYQTHCMSHKRVPGTVHLLSYLVRHHLIDETSLRHYVILESYQKMLEEGQYRSKNAMVKILAQQLCMHENSIYNVIKDHKNKFLPTPSEPDAQPVPAG
ncbi:MAG: hypothetical protein AAF206_22390 [Bacteroidota bacterium]